MIFSFLMPTRERPDLVLRFIQSVVDTTYNLDDLEIILCIDEDDELSKSIEDERVSIKKVVVPKGLNMGELNRKCFDSSSGRYVMLINDDVILRSKNWDRTIMSVFRGYEDEIALIHVNDLLFREKLCTFPFLSRKACDAIGICPAEYKRYRIDDHIWDTYCVLAYLGHKRIVYLPNVIFQHDNHSEVPEMYDGQLFVSEDNKAYIPNKLILEKDADFFDRSFHQRKQDALKLAAMIDQSACSSRISTYVAQLESVREQYSCRKPEYLQRMPLSASTKPLDSVTVTIGVVTADFRSAYASRCLSLLKQHTSRFDLILLDNNSSKDFNHPREMNKILRTAKTDYVVLMDDDVLVKAGWLEGMLRAMDNDTGVVTPMHKDKRGVLSFSGAYFMGDDFGTHVHHKDVPDKPREIQCACSAILLIDMKKCGNVRFDEQYNKYFLDIDYSLKIWETGYKLIVTPQVVVTHLAGATLAQGSIRSTRLWNQDMVKFKKEWIDSGRLSKLQNTAWKKYPFLMLLTVLPKRIRSLLEREPDWEFSDFQKELEEIIEIIQPFPLFQSLLVTRLKTFASRCHDHGDNLKADYCRSLLVNQLKNVNLIPEGFVPILVESYKGYNLVEYGETILCCPQSLGPLNLTQEENRCKPGILSCMNLSQAKDQIDKIIGNILEERKEPPHVKEVSVPDARADTSITGQRSVPILVEEGYKGFNIILCGDRYYAIRQGEGEFDLAAVGTGRYTRVFEGYDLGEIKTGIDKARLESKIKRIFHWIKSLLFYFSNENITTDLKEIEYDCSGFSIYLFATKYFAIPLNQRPFNIGRYRENLYSEAFVGNTVEEVKREIGQRKATQAGQKPKALFLGCVSTESAQRFLSQLSDYDITLLIPQSQNEAYAGYPRIILLNAKEEIGQSFDVSSMSAQQFRELRDHCFDLVILPHTGRMYWKDTQYETFAGQLSNRLMIVTSSGQRRFYKGEDIHRIRYNKAYLNSMLSHIPTIAGKSILDVGCSDGLVCDLLLSGEPDSIVGIDVLETVGCSYHHERIKYYKMDASCMSFSDKSFDLTLSIATLEHIGNPQQALRGIKRVTKPGGYIYVQAGPLYYSPFGHHMFAYFDDYPWIHLRMTPDQIIDYCRRNGIDKKMQNTLGRGAEDYVHGMINREHVNERSFEEYGLLEFMEQDDIEVINFSRSWEGENLLTKEILSELYHIGKEKLTSHGFELVARVK